MKGNVPYSFKELCMNCDNFYDMLYISCKVLFRFRNMTDVIKSTRDMFTWLYYMLTDCMNCTDRKQLQVYYNKSENAENDCSHLHTGSVEATIKSRAKLSSFATFLLCMILIGMHSP